MPGSLLEMLTLSALRAQAGASFARGEAYWHEGRVVSYHVHDGVIDGTVMGQARYHVRLARDAHGLTAACTCPVDAAVCKHAVAVALAYLRGETAPPRAPGAPAPTDATQEHPRCFSTRAELEAWAATHDVVHALARSAKVLIPQLPFAEMRKSGVDYFLARRSIGEVGSLEGARLMVGAGALERPIALAAYEELERAAAAVRAACAEENARPKAAPEPALAPLWSALAELRAQVRAHATPRPRAARARGTWQFAPADCAVAWRDPDAMFAYGQELAVAARLTMVGGTDPQLACTCQAPGARCTHTLALIDATLDVLEAPDRRDEARTVAEELLRPSWSRLLRELDAAEERAARLARPRAAIELWWQIERVFGAPTLTALVKKQSKRGTLSAGSRRSAAQLLAEYADTLAPIDREIAEHIAAWQPPARTGTSSGARTSSYPVRAFAALVGHPRVLGETSGAPLAVTRTPLGFTAQPSGAEISLEPTLDGARLPPKELAAMLGEVHPGEPLVLEQPDRARCLLIDVSDDARRLWQLLAKHGDRFPPEAHAPLLDRLARLEGRVPLAVPEALLGAPVDTDAVTVARLRLLPDAALEVELWIRPGAGAPLFQPGSGPRDVLLARGDGSRGYVRRALGDEPARARQTLEGLLPEGAEEGPPFCYRIGDPDGALGMVAALETPPPGLEVEWLDARPTIRRGVGPEALRVQIERRRDWFGMTGELTIEAGRLELAVLLDAARRQQRFVRLDAGRWVELSERLRAGLTAIADRTFAGREGLELSPGAAPAVSELADDGARVDAAVDWRALTTRMAQAMALAPRPPAQLAAELRDYQRDGYAWMARVAAWGAGACLADDMGLGKTVQAIALLVDRARLGPALVLAPTSVAINWAQELARFAPGLSPVIYADLPDRAARLAKLRKKDVVVVSYGLLVRDAALLARTTFATLVIDEAQALKNASTRRARAARQLDAGFRVALSGTPLENHLGELWSLFAVVFPGLLGSWDQFRDRFAGPIERSKDADARASLARVLRPFLLRRTKQEVASELPSRTEVEVPVALSKDERALYEDARLAAIAELGDKGAGLADAQQRFQVLAALTRLRLLACHPRLYDGRSPVASSKLRRLLELVDELRSEGHRALVFSQFTSHLALVREALAAAGHRTLYLDGSTPARQRAALIAEFQAGGADLFLLSLKAGGTGINLTSADYVIHLDPWWNPAVEDQATDRAHRIGQTRPVTVYRLIARGTIEEQIVAMHGDKRALVASVLDGSGAAARLTTQDLLGLLAAAHGGEASDDDDEAGDAPAA